MKLFLLAIIFCPLVSFCQMENDIYISFINSNGKPIVGTSLAIDYEKWIEGNTINNAGKNNSQLTFTMPISGSIAEFKRALNTNLLLRSGQVVVVKNGKNGYVILYSIKMEDIKVVSCSETISRNNSSESSIVLQATRIGWTFYQHKPDGSTSVSNKYGFDLSTGTEWKKF